jgi:hypothetical protein
MLAGLPGRIGLHGPKALHRNWSFASGPCSSHYGCNGLSPFTPDRTSGLPPHERLFRFAPVPLPHPGLSTHVASLTHCSERTFWIRPAAVCRLPKKTTDTTVLPPLMHRRLAPVNISSGNRVVKNLTLACALIKNSRGLLAGHRFIFALSIPVARDFWCRPSSPLAGAPTALLVRPAALDSKVFGRFSRLTITGGRGCCCQLLPRLAPKQVSGKPAT